MVKSNKEKGVKLKLEMDCCGVPKKGDGLVLKAVLTLNKNKTIKSFTYDSGEKDDYNTVMDLFGFKLKLEFSGPFVVYEFFAANGDLLWEGGGRWDQIAFMKILYNGEQNKEE